MTKGVGAGLSSPPLEGDRTAPQRAGWFVQWFDCRAARERAGAPEEIDWTRCAPFIAMHVACLGALVWGVSAFALTIAIGLYALRMFFITGFYHRYFSHRAFKTSRWFQAVMATLGCTALQGDPMWWASHHFEHHANSDEERDPHSPVRSGFWRSHLFWWMTRGGIQTREQYVRDWAEYGELRFLNRFDKWPGLLLALGLFGLGAALERFAPGLETNGLQLLTWGFFISTIAVYHVTFTINSLAHVFGSRRYQTSDNSRNNWLLALLTLGEGWHNNHHHYPGSARQGFRWWEIDITYYGLKLLAWIGLIWDLRPVPPAVMIRNLVAEQ